MLGGQVEDIKWNYEGDANDNANNIIDIYLKKTSALLCASLEAGALLSGANREQISYLNEYGKNIGLAFQITDDLLDFKQNNNVQDRPAYPLIFGLEKSKEDVRAYCHKAKESLLLFGDKADMLIQLVDYIQYRKN